MTTYDHGGNVWEVSRRTGVAVGDLIDFSANINPLGPPPSVIRQLTGCADVIEHYPDPDYIDLRRRIGAIHRMKTRSVAVGAGASELLYSLVRAAGIGRALLAEPTFSEYARAVKNGRAEGRVIRVGFREGEEFCFNERMRRTLLQRLRKEKPDCLFLCRPNSPTGSGIPRKAVGELAATARRMDAFVFVDESFAPFGPEWPGSSAAKLLDRHPNLAVVVSLTKILAVPGLRIGYLLGPARLVDEISRVQAPWPVSLPAARAARAGLEDEAFFRRSRRRVMRQRPLFARRLRSVQGVTPFPSVAPFLLLRLQGPFASRKHPAKYVRDALSKRGVLVRDCSGYPGLDQRFIRVAVRLPEENAVLVEALRKISSRLKGGSGCEV